MRNVSKYALKTCIFLDENEFEDVIEEIYGENASCSLSDGVKVYNGEDRVFQDELYPKLAEYFDVSKVVSIHADDCSYSCWIVYEE